MASARTRFLVFGAALALSASIAGPVMAQDESTAPAESMAAAAEPVPFPDDAKPYIPIISKGFQHQFWQAVKLGSEQAAKDLNVDITFEGPESEAMVDKQVEMFQTALDKHPAAICLAAVDSKAFQPLLEKAKAAGIPVV